MSFEKNIGKQLNFQKELDEAGSREEAVKEEKMKAKRVPLGERDDPWDDLGPNYEEQKRKERERKKREEKEAKRIRDMYRENDRIKRRNYDNRY